MYKVYCNGGLVLPLKRERQSFKQSSHCDFLTFAIFRTLNLNLIAKATNRQGREGQEWAKCRTEKKKKVKAAELTIIFQRLCEALKFWYLILVTKIVMRTGNGTTWIHCPDNDLMRMGNGESITNSHYDPEVVILWFCSDAAKWRMSDISWESARKSMKMVTLCSLKVMAECVSDEGVGHRRGRRGIQSMAFVCSVTI